ncbi:hypothetical protein [Thermocrinis sp.]
MIGKVFRIFREKGGILKALDLWDWYESLEPRWQKKVKHYFSLKTIKSLNFPYRAKDFDSGEVQTAYTKRTFLGSLAQTALLEKDLETAEWLYLQALEQEGSPYEEHLILNDLLLLYQRQRNFEKMEHIAKRDIELFPDYVEELKKRNGENMPQIYSFELLVYLLERRGEVQKALELVKKIKELGISYPQEEEVLKRLIK